MKTLWMRITVPVAVEVPDDFPVAPEALAEVADWRTNDCSDGRLPYSTEKLLDGAIHLCEDAVESAIFDAYCRRVEAHFGRRGRADEHLEARNALVARCRENVHVSTRHAPVEITVVEDPRPYDQRFVFDAYIVLCREDPKDGEEVGEYRLATRTVFWGREAANAYARTVAHSREPIVAPLPIGELRIGEERGRLDYWERKAPSAG